MGAVLRALGVLTSLTAHAAAAQLAVLAYGRLDRRPRTDDAYPLADLMHMVPDIQRPYRRA